MFFLLLSVQSLTTVMLLWVFRFLNLIKYREFSAQEGRLWMPIVVFLVAMIYSGSQALKHLSIPVYTIFKNLTIILIAYGEVLWFGGDVTMMMLVSFILITLSSTIAGWSDVQNAVSNLVSTESLASTGALRGYMWMFANCMSSAAFVLYMRKRIKLTNFKDFDTVYYNNLLSIPLLLVPSLVLEDWSSHNLLVNFPPDERAIRLGAMVFSGAATFFMSYSSAWCVRTTSSTTYSMVGSLNKLPIAVSGIIFFGDPATLANISAITIGFIAGIVYSIAKSVQKATPTQVTPTDQSKLEKA
ncbi:hypothetical protein BC940DRAFT_324716 [Gongronella butleri]|nr:hypothetical protein BC940DRAFT_324716 [Gongronella butleri]